MSSSVNFRDILNEEMCSESSDEESDSGQSENEEGAKKKVKKSYQIPISQRRADELYDIAGTEEIEVKGELVILPAPSVLTSEDEGLIMEAKRELGILHDLDDFQIQSVLSLINDTNVVLVSPCGSGKMLVFYLALHCLRKKKCNPRGIGVCLEPLNNILCEKNK